MQTANWLAVGVIVASTVLNAATSCRSSIRAFFCDPPSAAGHGHGREPGEAPWPIVLALTMTAAGTVVLFFCPDIPFTLATLMTGR